jgi:hypothetical protein
MAYYRPERYLEDTGAVYFIHTPCCDIEKKNPRRGVGWGEKGITPLLSTTSSTSRWAGVREGLVAACSLFRGHLPQVVSGAAHEARGVVEAEARDVRR